MLKVKPLVWETEVRIEYDYKTKAPHSFRFDSARFGFGHVIVAPPYVGDYLEWFIVLDDAEPNSRLASGKCTSYEEGRTIGEEKYRDIILSCLEQE